MKNLCAFLLLMVLVLNGLTAQDTDTLFVSIHTEVMVFDRVASSDALADWAEDHKGYFTWKSEQGVRLRVPDAAAKEFRPFLEGLGEQVLVFDQTTEDLREELSRRRSALEAREEILAKNLTYLESSDVNGTLELEREIRRLMTEIDENRGYLNRLEHDRRMALIDVNLQFRQQTIPEGRPSRFGWINSVDFYQFMNTGIHSGSWRLWPYRPITLPEGFAEVSRHMPYMAMSPEGVLLSVRSVKNYPEQTVEFWTAALQAHLEKRGYRRVDRPSGTEWGGDGPFESLLWAVPWGNENYLYLTALRVVKGKIEILELAGDARYVTRYLPQ